MLIDLSPLRISRDYRLLFFGQLVSFFGTMISIVAMSWQMYTLTGGSSTMVGLIALAQFFPMFTLSFVGGAIADAFDRRRILRMTEVGQTVVTGFLIVNSLLAEPSIATIFVCAALHSGLAAIQRPAFESFIQSVIPVELSAEVRALNSLRWSIGAVLSPVLAGIITTTMGASSAYAIDFVTFAASLFAVFSIGATARKSAGDRPSFRNVGLALRYALVRRDLLGTYLVDIAAMFFASPRALYPALASQYGDQYLGFFFGAIGLGSLLAAVTSGWTKHVRRHGRMVAGAAILWGACIVVFGFAGNVWVALAFLVLGGFFDMISSIFRGAVWNQSIPNFMRGRLASIEMISYLSGPYLGSAKMGFVAERWGVGPALISGGLLCVVAVAAIAALLPGFYRYDGIEGIKRRETEEAEREKMLES